RTRRRTRPTRTRTLAAPRVNVSRKGVDPATAPSRTNSETPATPTPAPTRPHDLAEQHRQALPDGRGDGDGAGWHRSVHRPQRVCRPCRAIGFGQVDPDEPAGLPGHAQLGDLYAQRPRHLVDER